MACISTLNPPKTLGAITSSSSSSYSLKNSSSFSSPAKTHFKPTQKFPNSSIVMATKQLQQEHEPEARLEISMMEVIILY
ncbi:hypothetical protein HanRHA438_Chr17g0796471 [Helianthus annuus]|uniref:Uncharacterized protein n=1 Tax=Helianthus annuus TaxID=4232 RepID=A0A251RLH3_HELAN|nr:hypothetical protein HanXRQr2_Chr17g0785931 [Helianthus annuus]KAJ0427942.1 hypothetical protein HanHA300_Chr17g0640701 [Helianthus annuus]KAJ0446250.1 hypothetical protein HanHA89_Chr17g0692281 [Helianthus annuus]KAJ0631202.1 hypothetical protein HanLR1_Chr17g0651461 [Helianthus annuus]KAJ0635076.1 hypothetical protein HanOQP8_Chr17g0646941 [Helianthus annuus]